MARLINTSENLINERVGRDENGKWQHRPRTCRYRQFRYFWFYFYVRFLLQTNNIRQIREQDLTSWSRPNDHKINTTSSNFDVTLT